MLLKVNKSLVKVKVFLNFKILPLKLIHMLVENITEKVRYLNDFGIK